MHRYGTDGRCYVTTGFYMLTEGKSMLIQELGKKYGNYFSLLAAIASGNNTFPTLEEEMGKNMGGLLNRLEEDYELIKKKRPILAKEGTQAVRYEISDLFLRFGSDISLNISNTLRLEI